MADVNQGVIIGTIGITAIGIIKSATGQGKQPIGNVLVGGYVLGLIAATADLAGGAISRLVGGIMMVALAGSVMWLFGTPFFQNIGTWLSGKPTVSTNQPPPQKGSIL